MNKKNFVIGLLFGIFALATNIFILVEAGTPGGASGMQSTGVSQAIGDAINTMVPSHPIDTSDPNYLSFMRKFIGHFSLFGVSGIFTILSLIFFLKDKFKSNWFIFLISSGSGFFFAGLSEIIQLFTDGRAGTFKDVLIDFAGYLLYSIIVFLIFLLINYVYKKKRLKESIS